ncbi:MAG: hypothetical protein WB586_30040 [Chthoniobacterales bacterium]
MKIAVLFGTRKVFFLEGIFLIASSNEAQDFREWLDATKDSPRQFHP